MISKHIDSFFHFVLPVMVLVLFIIPLNAAQIDFLPVGNMKKYAKNLYDLDVYALKTFDYSDNLPWDFIDIKPGKDFLVEESKRLLIQEN